MDEVLRLTVPDLAYLLNTLEQQDVAKQLGKCEDHMDDQGYCKMCTALQRLDTFITESKDKNAGFWYRVGHEEEGDW